MGAFFSCSSNSGSHSHGRDRKFWLIAELSEYGNLTDFTRTGSQEGGSYQELLSKAKRNSIAFIGVIDDETYGKQLRVIDSVQFHLEERFHKTSFMDWKKQAGNHFPRIDDQDLPWQLRGKNGILLQVHPYQLSKSLKQDIYLLSIWIGNPDQMTASGFGKLRDLLYLVSSFVFHSTNVYGGEQMNNKWLCDSPALISLEYASLESVCFLFFNLTGFDMYRGQTLASWLKANPTNAEAACRRISETFCQSYFRYLNEAMPAAPLFELLHQPDLQRELQYPVPAIKSITEAQSFFADRVNFVNSPFETCPRNSIIRMSRKPKTSLQKEETTVEYIRRKSGEVFEFLLSKNPSVEASEVDRYQQWAFEQVEKSLKPNLGLQNVQQMVLSEWNNFNLCLAELDNLMVDLEAQALEHLLSTSVNEKHLEASLKTTRKEAQAVAESLFVSQNIVSLRTDPVFKNISSIISTLTKINEVDLNQYCLSDTAVANIRDKAVAEFNNRGFGNLGLAALESVLNNFVIENVCRCQQSEVLAGETVHFAVAEYQKAMDEFLKKGIYSTQKLDEIHDHLATLIVDSFKSSYPTQIKVLKTIKAQLRSQLPKILDENYINSVEANRRRLKVHIIAYEAFKKSRGADYDQLGRRQKRVHDDARRAALDVFLEQAASEQPWMRKQWYDELFERIQSEGPDDVQSVKASSGTSVELSDTRQPATVPPVDDQEPVVQQAYEGPSEVAKGYDEMEVDGENDLVKNALESLIKEVESMLDRKNSGVTRIVQLKAKQSLKDAKKLLEGLEPSEAQLNLMIEQLKLWRDSLLPQTQ